MPRTRRVNVVDNSALARLIGARVREVRLARGLSQRKLAEPRYTGAYVSALELGHAKPSMAALSWISDRLQVPMHSLLATDQPATELENLASIMDAVVTSDEVRVRLDDGRRISVPVTWMPALSVATIGQLRNWRVESGGQLLRWPELGATLPLRTIVLGRARDA